MEVIQFAIQFKGFAGQVIVIIVFLSHLFFLIFSNIKQTSYACKLATFSRFFPNKSIGLGTMFSSNTIVVYSFELLSIFFKQISL